MTRSHLVKKARKESKTDAGEVIAVGTPYYWWKFRYGGIHRSLRPPTPRQLTQNAFKQSVFDFEDQQSAFTEEDLRGGGIEDLTNTLETMRDEAQDSHDNMPEGLQDSSDSGQLLQERVDALQEMIDELEAIDVPEEPDVNAPEPVKPELPQPTNEEEQSGYDSAMENYEQALADYREERETYENDMETALSEVQNVSYEGP